jgi:hypothetical protein
LFKQEKKFPKESSNQQSILVLEVRVYSPWFQSVAWHVQITTIAFAEAVKYLLTNFKTITSYYDNGLWHNKAKFNKYISKQRATAEICKRLLNGSNKYSPSASPGRERSSKKVK